MTASMTLDLTELRNKVSKIKVNPRGNLWATGKNQITMHYHIFVVVVLLYMYMYSHELFMLSLLCFDQ